MDFDSTKNLFIEGDNLEALKILQDNYLGKVKMIYIDPPYNTGGDFVYSDDFSSDRATHFLASGQSDADGNRLVANTAANGRFHSDWLSMIYSRIKLARNLLTEDGVIFVSIDDREAENAKHALSEALGRDNFLAQIVWEKVHTRKNSAKTFSISHEYVIAFAKSKENWDRILLPRENTNAYSNPDNHPKGPWKLDPVTAHNPYDADYEIRKPNGVVLKRPRDRYWAFSEATLAKKIANDEVVWGEGSSYPMIKRFLSEVQDGLVPITLFDRKFAGDTSSAKGEVDALFEERGLFDYPKPVKLLEKLIQISCRPKDIILDFFAGSSTTADAVMRLNAKTGGNRQFIMVQLPEPTPDKSPARLAGFDTVADLSKERIRRAGKKILEGECHPDWNRDVGFRVLKVDTSNMKDVYYRPDELKQSDLPGMVDNVKEGRTAEDLLFQVLVDWGVDLTLPIRRETVQGKTVFFVDDNALVACFDRGITEDLVKELAGHEPLRVVFRDNGFVSDAVKINVEQIFRQLSPTTDVKSI